MKRRNNFTNPNNKMFFLILNLFILLNSTYSFKTNTQFRSKSQSLLSSKISFENLLPNEKDPNYDSKLKELLSYSPENGNNLKEPEEYSSSQSKQEKTNYKGESESGIIPPFKDNTQSSSSFYNLQNQLIMPKQLVKRTLTVDRLPVLSSKPLNEFVTESRQNWKTRILTKTKGENKIQQEFKLPEKKAKLLDSNSNQIIKTGWMKISSIKFANRKDFPEMTQDCGKMVQLTLDSDYFLMNIDNKDNELESLVKSEMQYYFYFRLNNLNLYFTISKDERHILGSILIMSINSIDINFKYSNNEFCFKLNDMDLKYWILCATDNKEKLDWVCKIYKLIGKISTLCIEKSRPENTIETIIEEPTIIITSQTRFCNDNWNYLKQGEDWECDCCEGTSQSPIDLPHPGMAIPTMIRPVFQYEKVKVKAAETDEETLMVMGENIKLRFKQDLIKLMHNKIGTVITQDKLTYQAQEIQFHLPAEHTIMGRRHDMEMQIIHNGDGDGIGRQLILSFLFKKSPGVKNLFFQDLDYFNLPNSKIPERDLINEIFLPKIFYSEDNEKKLYQFKDFSFYTYEGSLTSPPCAESTIIYVVAEPIALSTLIINLFKEALDHNLDVENHDEEDIVYRENNFIPNYRKTQNLNGRDIFYFDCKDLCVEEITQEKTSDGHYEKLTLDAYMYYYVDSVYPTGIPDSYVVPPEEAKSLDVEMASDLFDS